MSKESKELLIKEANDELIKLLDIHDNEFGDKILKKEKMNNIVINIEGNDNIIIINSITLY